MKTVSILIVCLNGILIISALIPAGVIVYRIMTDSGNHWGVEIQYLHVPYIFIVIVCCVEISLGVTKNKVPAILVYTLLVVSIAGIAGLIVIEKFNILIEYDRWLRKGQPLPLSNG